MPKPITLPRENFSRENTNPFKRQSSRSRELTRLCKQCGDATGKRIMEVRDRFRDDARRAFEGIPEADRIETDFERYLANYAFARVCGD